MDQPANRPQTDNIPLDVWYRKVAGAAVAAGAGFFACTQDAQAQIVLWTTNISTTGTVPTSSSIFFDYLTGTSSNTSFAGNQFELRRAPGAFDAGENYANLAPVNINNQAVGVHAGNYFYPTKLAAGAAIGPAQGFLTGPVGGLQTLAATVRSYGNWRPLPSGTAFLGLRFGDGTNFNYGWAEIAIDSGGNMNLTRFAYNTALNQPILAGQTPVPEPSSMALMVMGAAGMAAYRNAASKRSKRPRNRTSRSDSPLPSWRNRHDPPRFVPRRVIFGRFLTAVLAD